MHRLSPSLLLIPFILLALGLLLIPAPTSAAPAIRHITIDATQYQFTPGRVRVNRGDRVVITLTASDVVHGFYLDGYGLKTRVEPGIAQQIEFVADRPGKFRYRCLVSCGPLHPFMIGELVVGPNLAFWRAGGLTLTALAGMLAYLWRSGNRTSVIMEALYE
jgi:heme/copper-type cytochrome/quinol oxidase subunit 2